MEPFKIVCINTDNRNNLTLNKSYTANVYKPNINYYCLIDDYYSIKVYDRKFFKTKKQIRVNKINNIL